MYVPTIGTWSLWYEHWCPAGIGRRWVVQANICKEHSGRGGIISPETERNEWWHAWWKDIKDNYIFNEH